MTRLDDVQAAHDHIMEHRRRGQLGGVAVSRLLVTVDAVPGLLAIARAALVDDHEPDGDANCPICRALADFEAGRDGLRR